MQGNYGEGEQDKAETSKSQSPLQTDSALTVEQGDNTSHNIWSETVSNLEHQVDTEVYRAYLKPLSFLGFNQDEAVLHVSAPSRLISQHVSNHFSHKLTDLFSSSINMPVSLKISISAPSEDGTLPVEKRRDSNQNDYVVVKKIKARPSDGAAAQRSGEKSNDGGIMPRYTFSNFVVGSGNQFCHAAANHVAEEPGHDYNPLFIYGGVGLGKTHLLHAIGNATLEKDPTKKVLYLSSETFTNELILALRFAKMDEFKKRFRNIDLLLIDDIQFMCGKERTQEEFFHTFNALYSAKHQIVITSDKIPQDIPGIEERLQTRFAWGLTADIQAPDFETRVAILKRKAAADKCPLPEDVAHFIAERVSSNVRELEGALTRLHAHCSLQRVEISLEIAESALRPLLKKKKVHLTIEEIQRIVSQHFGIRVSEMISKRRTKNLSFPRHVAMYLCRKHTTSSYPEIGAKFGGRDHSSVIHAANVVTTKVKDSSEVRNHIEEIENRLFNSHD